MTRCYFTSVKVKVVIPTCATTPRACYHSRGEEKADFRLLAQLSPSPHPPHASLSWGKMCWVIRLEVCLPAHRVSCRDSHKSMSRCTGEETWREGVLRARRMLANPCHLACHHLPCSKLHSKAWFSYLGPRTSQPWQFPDFLGCIILGLPCAL